MRSIKNKPILYVFAIGISVMLSHSIVPHHHHSHSIALHEENNCDEDETHENEHEEPLHCHAFNDTDWYIKDTGFANSWQQLVFFFLQFVDKKKSHLPAALYIAFIKI
jgi:hypothetical protein